MNCLKEGHTSTFCKETMMCPYCAEAHPADQCKYKGMMTSNCTACARRKKATDPTTDLKQLFSTTPRELRHSPLDPTCPARVAEKVARVNQAPAGEVRQPGPNPTVSNEDEGHAPHSEPERPAKNRAPVAEGDDEPMSETVLC